MSVNGSSPLIVALFYGDKKPDDIHHYLSDFIIEYKKLESDGFEYDGHTYFVKLVCVVADAPARSFIKQIMPHNSYNSCECCTVVGTYRGRVVYDEMDCPLRTDSEFENNHYDGTHQTGVSPFSDIIGCVSGFSLDYMHLVSWCSP